MKVLDLIKALPRTSQYLFPNRKGEAFSPTVAGPLVKEMGKAAGLGDKVSPHWLRHSHATNAYLAGADLVELQETLGHSSFNTTRIYIGAAKLKSSSEDL